MIAGGAITFQERLPPPTTIRSRPIPAASTQEGHPSGLPTPEAPPISAACRHQVPAGPGHTPYTAPTAPRGAR